MQRTPPTLPLSDDHSVALRKDQSAERWLMLSLAGPALLLVLVCMLLPVGWLFYLSFFTEDGAASLVNYRNLIEQPSYARIFRTTFEVSLLTTAICALVGYPLAYFLSQLPTRIANLCMIAVLLPFWTSLLVRTYAWLILLQRTGLINTWGIDLGLWSEPLPLVHNMTGTLIGMVHIMLPFVVLPLYNSMRTIDRSLIQAAANLGASPVQGFWRVFFPLSLPGLMAGSLVAFILCLGVYVTPAVLGGGKVIMVSSRIALDIDTFLNWGSASALGVVLLLLTFLLLLLASRLTKGLSLLGSGH
ncbi:MAG: ABC transporter permease [Pseudolabrys sp.]|jgi:ABC-type spermidine/putrescine transport system permease subunit I|nr:ABC transporter permease [Pseudolabrys sp.]